MLNISEIRKKYSVLYQRLKSEGVDYLEKRDINQEIKQDILELIRTLPHPSVASLLDIKNACEACSAGKLEYLFEIVGNYARNILKQIREAYPDEEREGISLPPVVFPIETETQNLTNMIQWSNETIFHSYKMLREISRATDITLKAQCPYCMGDLVEVIVQQKEIHLRCKSQTKSRCRTVDWLVGFTRKCRSPP